MKDYLCSSAVSQKTDLQNYKKHLRSQHCARAKTLSNPLAIQCPPLNENKCPWNAAEKAKSSKRLPEVLPGLFSYCTSYLKCFVLEVAFSYLCSGLADDQMQSQSFHSHWLSWKTLSNCFALPLSPLWTSKAFPQSSPFLPSTTSHLHQHVSLFPS